MTISIFFVVKPQTLNPNFNLLSKNCNFLSKSNSVFSVDQFLSGSISIHRAPCRDIGVFEVPSGLMVIWILVPTKKRYFPFLLPVISILKQIFSLDNKSDVANEQNTKNNIPPPQPKYGGPKLQACKRHGQGGLLAILVKLRKINYILCVLTKMYG